MTAEAPTRRRRWLRLALALALGACASCALAELALRFFLFNTSRFALEHGRSLRELSFYGDRSSDDEVWKLQWRMNDAAILRDAGDPDPRLGWTGTVARGTYLHPDAGKVGERRPVLLYGDSFSQGVTEPEAGFTALLERSELARTHALLNYGVGGYGFDQTYLFLRATLDTWTARDPIVLVGCFVDDDLDRSVLTFRGWPKPRFGLEGETLVEPQPVETSTSVWLEQHPLSIDSYLWRFLKYRRRILPRPVQVWLRGDERRLAEKRALNRALLVAVHRLLEERKLRHALIGFLGEGALTHSPGCEWQEDWLASTCREIGLPLVSTRGDLEALCGEDEARRKALFFQDSGPRGHYNATGNAAAFGALRRAIEGNFDR